MYSDRSRALGIRTYILYGRKRGSSLKDGRMNGKDVLTDERVERTLKDGRMNWKDVLSDERVERTLMTDV